MRQIKELGDCPKCGCTLWIYKTKQYKRFVKCEICGLSYPLPKAGKISNSALECERYKVPLLIVEKNKNKPYYWSQTPCFDCVKHDKCENVKMLDEEFKDEQEIEVY